MRLLLSFLLFVCSAIADTVTGRVVGVHDGDTLTVLTAEKERLKIRLWGIDAPELGQAFGRNSKESLSDMAFDRTAEVEVKQKDRYGRAVAVVKVGEKNLNLAQVEQGMAWWYFDYAKRARELEDAEGRARAAKLGLWADKAPVPPWQWRKEKKSRK